MATGKSSVGKELARKLGREFVDLDGCIEERSGKRIKDIFTQAGESFFRMLEGRLLSEMSARGDLVVSCGGGIVIAKDNITVMKRTGRILCLSASLEEVMRRSAASDTRPLLDTGDKKEAAERLLAERAALYARAADMTIDTTALGIGEVVERALALLQRSGDGSTGSTGPA